jgi:hypothetical protein
VRRQLFARPHAYQRITFGAFFCLTLRESEYLMEGIVFLFAKPTAFLADALETRLVVPKENVNSAGSEPLSDSHSHWPIMRSP